MHSVDELFDVVVREEDDVRWAAIQELHALGTREVLDRARHLCLSASSMERTAGADVLGQLHSFRTEAADTLTQLLSDPEPAVVEAAVHGLAQQQDVTRLEALGTAAKHESADVRWAVATALEDLMGRDDRAEAMLLVLMRDSEASVRDRATFAVGSLSDHDSPRVRAALAERLKDEDPAVASEAALGLARRHDARAIPYIAKAVENFDEEVEEAVEEITAPYMLTDLLKARDALGDAIGLQRLIERCRERSAVRLF